MEPANKPPVSAQGKDSLVVEFLPDADELERTPLPRMARLTLHLMLLAFISFIVWASYSEVERVVIAKGKLVNPAPNIIVQPLGTSIIQSIDVRVGQVVRKGEKLAMLDATFTQADESQLKNRIKSLEIQQSTLRNELDGRDLHDGGKDADANLQSSLSSERRGNLSAQRKRLEEGKARLAASQESNKREQSVLQDRLRSAREMESMQEKLVEQNFGAKVQLLAARDRRLEVERDLLTAKNREQELRRDLAALEAELSALEKGWRQKQMEELLGITRERDALAEELQKANKRHRLETLYAPADGVVLEITKLSQGSIIKEAEPMLTIVPLGADMEAEIQIDSVDVGYVKPGDKVHVKLDAFPFQRHGMLEGEVRTISEDAFRRENNSAPGMEAFYQTRIAMKNLKLKNMSARTRLLPGMTLSAEIVVGKRSVMSYLIWPLTKALDESIREP